MLLYKGKPGFDRLAHTWFLCAQVLRGAEDYKFEYEKNLGAWSEKDVIIADFRWELPRNTSSHPKCGLLIYRENVIEKNF